MKKGKRHMDISMRSRIEFALAAAEEKGQSLLIQLY